MNTGPYKKIYTKPCDLCGNEIKIDQYGNGKCKVCGWNNDEPECYLKPNYPNMLSLADAKEAFKQGKKLLPTYEIFLDLISRGFEMAIFYKRKKYGAMRRKGVYDFYLWNSEENFQEYSSTDEFFSNANINGKLLKDIWNDIKHIEYDC